MYCIVFKHILQIEISGEFSFFLRIWVVETLLVTCLVNKGPAFIYIYI